MSVSTTARRVPVTDATAGLAVAANNQDELLDRVLAQTLADLGRRANAYAEKIKDPAVSHLERAVLTARSVNRLRAEITDEILSEIYSLMNSPLGFRTDRPSKNKPPYSKGEVKEAFILSLLNGLQSTGNEWNIIAGGMMIVQNGWRRKCRETPGLTDLEVSPGIPRQQNGVWQVRVGARWRYQEKPMQLHSGDGELGRPYAIPSYDGTGLDAIVGKALRRAYRDVYQMTTGSDWLVGCEEAEEAPAAAETPPRASRTEALAAKLDAVEPLSPAQASLPPRQEAVELEREDAERRLAEAIALADSTRALETGPGTELRHVAEWIGAARHERLMALYQERYRALQERRGK